MSIHSFVQQSINSAADGNHETAFHFICSAIDATAQLEYPHLSGSGKVGIRYKQFLRSNMMIIGYFAFNVRIHGDIIIGFNHPKVQADANGNAKLEYIIYHLIRCGLSHGTDIDKVAFSPTTAFKHDAANNSIILKDDLVWGLIAAVILSPTSSTMPAFHNDPKIMLMGRQHRLNDMRGDKNGFTQMLVQLGQTIPTCKDIQISANYAGSLFNESHVSVVY